MCSIIAGLSALMTVASGAMQYRAQQQQARAQEAALHAQAENERRQAEIAQQNANIEAKRQEIIADNYAQQGRELRDRHRVIAGQQRAQAGAAGIAMSGSALDILSAGDDAYARDQINLLNNQRLKNWDSRISQTNYMNDKASYLVSAENHDKDASYVRAQAKQAGMATILGTAMSVAGGIAGSIGGGGGGSSLAPSFSSVSSDMGHGTTATFSPSSGSYSFSSSPSWGNTSPRTYFGSVKGNTSYRRGNWF